MIRVISTFLILGCLLLLQCGTPTDPESLVGGTGGYTVVARYATAGYAQDVVVNDTLAFIAQGEGGLMIVGMSNPSAPNTLAIITGDMRGYSYKIAYKDSVIYLAAGNFGVSVVDVSNPRNPLVTATNLAMKPARDFHVMGNFLFTTISELGVKISEISYPQQPDIRGGMYTPGFARGICASSDSNFILVTCGEMGLAVYDITDLQNGFGTYQITGWIDTPGYAEDVVSHPSLPYAFVASGTGGMYVIDFSDAENPEIIGSYNTGGYAKEILYKDNRVYVTTELRGLQIFDVSDVTAPVKIGTIETEFALGLSIDENYVYVADDQEGLIIVAIPQ